MKLRVFFSCKKKKKTVDCMKKSSTAGLNKAQCYGNGKGYQYLDFNSVLGIFFKKLKRLQKYQYLLFEATNSGIIKAQMGC